MGEFAKAGSPEDLEQRRIIDHIVEVLSSGLVLEKGSYSGGGFNLPTIINAESGDIVSVGSSGAGPENSVPCVFTSPGGIGENILFTEFDVSGVEISQDAKANIQAGLDLLAFARRASEEGE